MSEEEKEEIGDIDNEGFGDPDLFETLSSKYNLSDGSFRTVRAMYIPRIGCIVESFVSSKAGICNSLTFVPGVKIIEDKKTGGKRLTKLSLVG